MTFLMLILRVTLSILAPLLLPIMEANERRMHRAKSRPDRNTGD